MLLDSANLLSNLLTLTSDQLNQKWSQTHQDASGSLRHRKLTTIASLLSELSRKKEASQPERQTDRQTLLTLPIPMRGSCVPHARPNQGRSKINHALNFNGTRLAIDRPRFERCLHCITDNVSLRFLPPGALIAPSTDNPVNGVTFSMLWIAGHSFDDVLLQTCIDIQTCPNYSQTTSCLYSACPASCHAKVFPFRSIQ